MTYTVTLADDNVPPGTVTQDVTITVTGTNDAPVISSLQQVAVDFCRDCLCGAQVCRSSWRRSMLPMVSSLSATSQTAHPSGRMRSVRWGRVRLLAQDPGSGFASEPGFGGASTEFPGRRSPFQLVSISFS